LQKIFVILFLQDLDVSVKVRVVPWRLLHVPPVLVHAHVVEDGCIEAAENLGLVFRVSGLGLGYLQHVAQDAKI
jgi:hypothetical protein